MAWARLVPARGGRIPSSPGRQRCGMRDPYVGDVNLGVPEADVGNFGKRDRYTQCICRSKWKHLIMGGDSPKVQRGEGESPKSIWV